MHPTHFAFHYNCGGLVLPSPTMMAELKKNGGESLTTCVQQILAPHYSNLILSRIKIHTSIPWIVQKTAKIIPAAITIDEDIYFSHRGSGGYDPSTIAGIKLIAHELTHTQQYKNYKTVVGFGWDYWDEYDKNKEKGMSDSDAYRNISFEINARTNADRVIQLVMKAYDNTQPCLNGQPNPAQTLPQLGKGADIKIKAIQDVLVQLGYLDPKYANGYMNRQTKDAVIGFQRNNGLKPDGDIGGPNSNTRKKLGVR